MQRYMQDTVRTPRNVLGLMRHKRLIYAAVTTGKVMNMAELSQVQGRAWDDVDVSEIKQAPLLSSAT